MTDTTSHEVLARLVAWFNEERGVSVDDAGAVTVAGDPPLQLRLSADEERAVITHERTEAGAGAARADQIIAAFPDRGTSMQAVAAVDRSGVKLTITNHVFVDGLNRQSAIAALNELVAALDSIDPTVRSAVTRVQQAIPIESEVPNDDTTSTGQVTAITDAAAEATSAAFSPTHRVPSGGMRAWSEPDPSLQPVARLEAGVELILTEQRGDWAHVLGSNGWTGWVDARQLVSGAAGASSPAAGLSVGGVAPRPLPLVGAVALIVSAFLPWVGRVGSTNSLDVPFSFLWDFTSSGDPQLGWFVIGLGVIALALAVMKSQMRSLLMIVGVLAVAMTGAFVVQMYRGVTDFGGDASQLFDWLGFAPWVALGAGVILIAAASMGSSTGE